MSKIRVAVNTEVVCLTPEAKEKIIDDQQYSLARNYKILDLTYKELDNYIKKGNAIAQVFGRSDKTRFHRSGKYFVSADWFGLDFDEGADELFKELLKLGLSKDNKALFIRKNACLFYTTTNHDKEKKGIKASRFRVIFHLPERVTDPEEFRMIVKAFLNKFPNADKQCKDPARYFFGTGSGGIVKTLGNQLTKETLKDTLKQNKGEIKPLDRKKEKKSVKTLPITERPLDLFILKGIDKNLELLKEMSVGNRNNTLNRSCFLISKIITGRQELVKKNTVAKLAFESTIKREIKKVTYPKIDESFTKEEIDKTIKRSFIEGKNEPYNDYTNELLLQLEIKLLNNNGYKTQNTYLTPEAKKKIVKDINKIKSGKLKDTLKKHLNRKITNTRLFENKNKSGCFQIMQDILTKFPTEEKIDQITEKELIVANKDNLLHTGSLAINPRDNNLNDIIDILKTKNNEVLMTYLSLFNYAKTQKSRIFNQIDLNKIIKNKNPNKEIDKKTMLLERRKIIKQIAYLSTITIFRQKKTEEHGIIDLTGKHLISNFIITNKNRHTYLTCELPEHNGSKGVHIPNAIFKLSRREKGAFNLAIALLKETFRINGFTNLKKGNNEVAENIKPIIWTDERLLKEIKTINTKNTTRRNQLISNILKRLNEKEIKIIDHHHRTNGKTIIYVP